MPGKVSCLEVLHEEHQTVADVAMRRYQDAADLVREDQLRLRDNDARITVTPQEAAWPRIVVTDEKGRNVYRQAKDGLYHVDTVIGIEELDSGAPLEFVDRSARATGTQLVRLTGLLESAGVEGQQKQEVARPVVQLPRQHRGLGAVVVGAFRRNKTSR